MLAPGYGYDVVAMAALGHGRPQSFMHGVWPKCEVQKVKLQTSKLRKVPRGVQLLAYFS